jgi:site-specific DNA-methyltransferase (adenine-specific)
MKDDGSMYIVSGWSNLSSIYKALDKLDLYTINHIVWKYNFGVATKSKFVSAHYHIFYISKNKKTKVKFNKNAYFSQVDKDISGRSLQYADMEDVWIINKEYQSSGMKNMNKLPSKLVEKIINYSSDKNDMVCDFLWAVLQPLTVH